MIHRVLGIPGSLRRGSLNRSLLEAAAELMPDNGKLELADLLDLPVYNWDVEQEAGFPEPVQRFRQQIAEADGLLFATPEYNYSMPGALKNALDWASRGGDSSPINRKPAAIMGAAGRLGSVRAQMHLRQVLLHSDLRVVQTPEVLVAGGTSFTDGVLTDDRHRDQIRRLCTGLIELIESS